MLSRFGPAPVKTDQAVRIQQANQVRLTIKVYNESLGLIDWFNPPSEKSPHGDNFRVGPKSDST